MLRIINQPCMGVKETFGRFREVLYPGWHFYLPLVSRIHVYDTLKHNTRYSLAVKTRDNVFCTLGVNTVHSVVDAKRRRYASYDPHTTLGARLEEVMRNSAAQFKLEDLFEAREKIQEEAMKGVVGMGLQFGIEVSSLAITDIDPDHRVKESMNKVNAALRERQAAAEKSEAKKLELVKEAEADAERKKLQGQGIADMRSAIIGGYRDRIHEMADSLGITPQQAIAMTLTTQYIEALADLAKSDNTKILFYSQDASHTVQDVTKQFGSLFEEKVISSH
jgi:regulator of protease activity HflC (stomatin/prohibitin superfamily)